MRTLSDTLTAAQKSEGINPLCKIVLTRDGEETLTYDVDDLLRVRHTERLFSHTANVFIDDNSATLHSIDLEGYQGVLSYGAVTSEGEEYSATAPLWVVGQQRDSHPHTTICSLELVGILDLLDKDLANASYSLDSDDTNTTKDLIDGIAAGTLAPFDHCSAVTVTYDTGYDGGDNLINNFVPADYFNVNLGDSRLSKIIELLAPTNNVLRVENDGELHIFKPTTSGESYDYEYSLGDTYHNFLSKRFRRRIVFPNYVTVMNHPNQGTYTGHATDASQSLIEKRRTYYLRATSDAQCTSLAEAILLRFQLDAERGAARIPIMNFGAEVHDYINITDSRTSDSIAGNLTYLARNFGRGQVSMDFGFGKSQIPLNDLTGVSGGVSSTSGVSPSMNAVYDYIEQILDILDGKVDINAFNKWYSDFISDAWFRKLIVVEQFRLPTWV